MLEMSMCIIYSNLEILKCHPIRLIKEEKVFIIYNFTQDVGMLELTKIC